MSAIFTVFLDVNGELHKLKSFRDEAELAKFAQKVKRQYGADMVKRLTVTRTIIEGNIFPLAPWSL